MDLLGQLVARDGPGDWAIKAKALGTGRSASSTGHAWRRLQALEQAASSGAVPKALGSSSSSTNPQESGQEVPQHKVVYEYNKR